VSESDALRVLIERVQAAVEPDRELDAMIACALRGYTIHADTDPKAGWFAYWVGKPEDSECVNCSDWPAYTGSLDAAWTLATKPIAVGHESAPGGRWYARHGDGRTVSAATPAIAVTVAALDAWQTKVVPA
jgi:hypothetical protein